MRYILSTVILFFFIACGNQEYGKSDIKLLNARESNKPNEKIIENNVSQNIQEEKLKIVENNLSQNIQEEKLKEDNETDKSIVALAPVIIKEKNISISSVKSEKLQLAELDAKVRAEILLLQSKDKRIVAQNEKELSLVKIKNEKELSAIELSNNHDIALAEIKSKKELSEDTKELDKIKSINNKEIALAKLQAQKEQSKAEEKIALAKLENQKELTDKNIAFYKMIAIIIAGLVILVLLIIYFINRRKEQNRLKLHEDELRHKEYMEASRQHNEHIGKMLDIVTDENADKGVKKEIVRLLKEQGKKGNLIEYKR